MTYTFKLARRLAMSRDYSTVAAALYLLGACAGADAISPDSLSDTDSIAHSGQVSHLKLLVRPRKITMEPGQIVRFTGASLSPSGDTVAGRIDWTVTGGTISTDGVFSPTSVGTYKVTARGRWWRRDTSTVVVVPTQPSLQSITMSPGSASLAPGATKSFAVIGTLSDGSTAPVGATWTATGGSIDAGGLYTAGSTSGTFRVIATSASDSLADTASVTISAPTLMQVVLSPSSTSVSTATTKPFKVWGRMSNGDSVAIAASFTATGGTISSDGLYTAGETPGTYRVIASSTGKADTAAVSVTGTPAGSGPGGAISFGPYNLWATATSLEPGAAKFTVSINPAAPSTIVTQIQAARTMGQKLIPVLTGPAADYLTNGNFDLAKWKARWDRFNTSAIRTAIAAGVSDGTVVGLKLIDEPEHKKWGTGLSKSVLDEMATYSKAYFPTAPTGISVGPPGYRWRTDQTFRALDWVLYQYDYWVTSGDVPKWRDAVLAQAKIDGVAPAFSLNILDGGVPDKDGTWDCTGAGQAGIGTYDLRCRMTATQVKAWGQTLAGAGCVLLMWRYDERYMSRSDNQAAFGEVAQALAGLSPRSCRRTG